MERPAFTLSMLAAGVIGFGGLALWIHSSTGNLALSLAVHAAGAGGLCLVYERSARGGRERLEALGRGLERLAVGGRGQLDADSADALGDMGRTYNRVCHAFDRSSARTQDLAARLRELPQQVAAALVEVERGADDQEAAVEETASLLANINTSIREINGEVEGLARSNEETAASIQEMGSAIEQVATSAQELQQTVEASTASIHEMGASIRRVAESSDEVQQVAQETAAATTEMDRAIQEVGEHVRGASDLTQSVAQRADEGTRAVGATISGIETIRDQTQDAKQALEGLAERIGEIGQIATVIGAISDETNLLSLNAAIIAAQAGDHGKAFAVVADQVKTLAQRTSSSAKQIEEMIRLVQTESGHAVEKMAAGIKSVVDGVERSRVAGEALEVIRTAAVEASGQVAEIARASEEQARNSKHVAGASQRVSDHVQQISHAMAEQSAASESLLRNANTYLDMCRQMAQAMEEQRATGRYITGNSHSITEMIHSIQRNTATHERASGAVAERFDLLLQNAHRSAQRIPEIARLVMDLRAEGESALAEVAGTGAARDDAGA